MSWRTMNSAPRDGTPIWCVLDFNDDGGPEQHAMRWAGSENAEFPWKFVWDGAAVNWGVREDVPTRWQPLPEWPK